MEVGGSKRGMIESIVRFFNEDQWNYQILEPGNAIRAGYRGEHGTWICIARAEAESRRFLFSAGMGMNNAPQYRQAVMEYFTRVNCGLTVGAFLMDLNTGDVRFKAGIEAPDGTISTETVRATAITCVQAMDHYFPGVIEVIRGRLTPEAALARVENQPVEGTPARAVIQR